MTLIIQKRRKPRAFDFDEALLKPVQFYQEASGTASTSAVLGSSVLMEPATLYCSVGGTLSVDPSLGADRTYLSAVGFSIQA